MNPHTNVALRAIARYWGVNPDLPYDELVAAILKRKIPTPGGGIWRPPSDGQ